MDQLSVTETMVVKAMLTAAYRGGGLMCMNYFKVHFLKIMVSTANTLEVTLMLRIHPWKYLHVWMQGLQYSSLFLEDRFWASDSCSDCDRILSSPWSLVPSQELDAQP